MKRLISFLKDEEGATAIEYGLIAALLSCLRKSQNRTFWSSSSTLALPATPAGGCIPLPNPQGDAPPTLCSRTFH